MNSPIQTPLRHPRHLGARLVRALRGLSAVRGWRRASTLLVPLDTSGAFTVANGHGVFTGDLGILIDREVYLHGGYETAAIEGFLARAPPGRRESILDIGANVGVHSLAFGRAFRVVHAFDPNPALWASFERNMALNGLANVTLHRMGLGRDEATLPLYDVAGRNAGLATFSATAQYDQPLTPIGQARVTSGDTVVGELGLARVDAIKIDVQGFEAEVLRGLCKTLARDRPLVWVEAGGEAGEAIRTLGQLRALFPYPIIAKLFRGERRWLTHGWRVEPAPDILPSGDYWITPST